MDTDQEQDQEHDCESMLSGNQFCEALEAKPNLGLITLTLTPMLCSDKHTYSDPELDTRHKLPGENGNMHFGIVHFVRDVFCHACFQRRSTKN